MLGHGFNSDQPEAVRVRVKRIVFGGILKCEVGMQTSFPVLERRHIFELLLGDRIWQINRDIRAKKFDFLLLPEDCVRHFEWMRGDATLVNATFALALARLMASSRCLLAQSSPFRYAASPCRN